MKLELDINDSILQRKNLTEFDVKMVIGVALLKSGVTSTGKTAEILDLGYRDFYENIGKYIDLNIELDINDLRRDLKSA